MLSETKRNHPERRITRLMWKHTHTHLTNQGILHMALSIIHGS